MHLSLILQGMSEGGSKWQPYTAQTSRCKYAHPFSLVQPLLELQHMTYQSFHIATKKLKLSAFAHSAVVAYVCPYEQAGQSYEAVYNTPDICCAPRLTPRSHLSPGKHWVPKPG